MDIHYIRIINNLQIIQNIEKKNNFYSLLYTKEIHLYKVDFFLFFFIKTKPFCIGAVYKVYDKHKHNKNNYNESNI